MAQQRDRAVDRPLRRQAPRQSGNARSPERGVNLPALRAIVASAAQDVNYDLEHCSAKRLGRRYVVEIVVDGDDGVDLDSVAKLSREISGALDRAEAAGEDIVPGEYDLEVGSPGVDRPLTTVRHWRRNIGRLVRVRAGGHQITARVMEVADDGVTLDEDGVVQRFAIAELGQGKVQVEFSRPSGGPDGGGTDEVDIDSVAIGADGIDDEGEDEE